MSGILTTQLKIKNAVSLYDYLISNTNYLYMFIGKTTDFPDDNAPPTPYENLEELNDVYKNIVYMKRIDPTYVTLSVPRCDWESNVVYAQWDSNNHTIFSNNYYVLTNDFRIYKCIDNNVGANSTIKPTATDTSVFTTADSYQWKFMYDISTITAFNSLHQNWIPIKILDEDDNSLQWDVQQAAIPGGIHKCIVTANGTNYHGYVNTVASSTNGSITLNGTFTGGNNIIQDYDIYISAGLGSGQIRRISAWDESIKVATITPNWTTNPDGTSSFNIAPAITYTGDGTTFKSYSEVSAGQVIDVHIVNNGINFTEISLSVVEPTNWTGNTATVRGIVTTEEGHGANAANELPTKAVILNCKFTASESNTLFVHNDYRQLGLLINPKLRNGDAANAVYYKLTTELTVANTIGTFVSDELVIGTTSNATGYIIESNSTHLSLSYNTGAFTVGEGLAGSNSLATANVGAIVNSNIKSSSGEILYYENRMPKTRSVNQTEDIKIVIKT